MAIKTNKEIEELIKNYNHILHQFRDADVEFQKTTKSEFIIKSLELLDVLFKANVYPDVKRQDICSFFYADCRKNEIDISYRLIASLASPQQKRNYSKSEMIALSTHEHDFKSKVDGGVLGTLLECECGIRASDPTHIIEFIEVESLSEDRARIAKEKKEKTKDQKLDEVDQLILMRADNADKNGKLWFKVFEARRDFPAKKEEIDVILLRGGGLQESIHGEKITQAKYKTIESLMDMREKLHLAETLRLNMYIFDFNLAKVASMLDLSAKWMHAVEARLKEGKDADELLRIVKEIHGCPQCNWRGYSFWLEHNKNRIKLNLEVIQPEKVELYCVNCQNKYA